MGNAATAAAAAAAGDRPTQQRPPVVEAMVWLARTGAPWRDLPVQYGSWKTVASRSYRWRRDGVFDRLLAEVDRRGRCLRRAGLAGHYVDGSVVRAHRHASRASLATRQGRPRAPT
jgi:transposase